MIPTVLAEQIQNGLKDYIDTTFPITNLVFKNSLKNMLSEPKALGWLTKKAHPLWNPLQCEPNMRLCWNLECLPGSVVLWKSQVVAF